MADGAWQWRKLKICIEYNSTSMNITQRNMQFIYFSTPENAFETIAWYYTPSFVKPKC